MISKESLYPELTPIELEIVNAIVDGLRSSDRLHQTLGDNGRSSMRPNQFGETALVMDIQAEETVLAALRSVLNSFQAFSEEHGIFTHGDNPQYTAVIDGLDGSGEYKEGGAD